MTENVPPSASPLDSAPFGSSSLDPSPLDSSPNDAPPNDAASPLDRHGLRTRVSAALTTFLDRQEEVLRQISPDLVEPAEALRSFLDGGKRMRPAFCYWGWRAAGGALDRPGDQDASSAIEEAALVASASLE